MLTWMNRGTMTPLTEMESTGGRRGAEREGWLAVSRASVRFQCLCVSVPTGIYTCWTDQGRRSALTVQIQDSLLRGNSCVHKNSYVCFRRDTRGPRAGPRGAHTCRGWQMKRSKLWKPLEGSGSEIHSEWPECDTDEDQKKSENEWPFREYQPPWREKSESDISKIPEAAMLSSSLVLKHEVKKNSYQIVARM